MIYRTRTYYSDNQKQEMWDRWQKAESIASIGRSFDRGGSSIRLFFSRAGGIRPRSQTLEVSAYIFLNENHQKKPFINSKKNFSLIYIIF